MTVEEFWLSVIMWQSCGQELRDTFLAWLFVLDWPNGNTIVGNNEVTVHLAWSVLRWVTIVPGVVTWFVHVISHLGQLSLSSSAG